MIEVVVFIAIASFLLMMLLLWARRSWSGEPVTREFPNLHEALVAFELELPPPALVERIFSSEDWSFVASHAPLSVQRRFLDERRTITRRCMRKTKEKVQRLMGLYRIAARHNGQLQLVTELRVAVQYASFVVVYLVVGRLIWLRGPFAAKRMVEYSRALAENLYSLTAQILVELDPAAFAKVRAEWKPG